MNPFHDPLIGLRTVQESKVSLSGHASEGFICPECKKKFATATDLKHHFEKKHNSKPKACRNELDGKQVEPNHQRKSTHIIGKLLKKLSDDSISKKPIVLSKEESFCRDLKASNYTSPFTNDSIEESFSANDSFHSCDGIVSSVCQSIGNRRSHSVLYREHREHHNEHTELLTNKLIIRLERILRDYPELDNFYARRTHEQQVVDWVPGNLVPQCPLCAHPFGLLHHSGRHHCRLCGCVMCYRCSVFFTLEQAFRLIVAPARSASPNCNDGCEDKDQVAHWIPPRIRQLSFASQTRPKMSFTSMGKALSYLSFELNPELDPNHWGELRFCAECARLVNIRGDKCNPIVDATESQIIKYYETIRELKTNIDHSLQIFINMFCSLRRGEQIYQLNNAHQLGTEIAANLIKLGNMCPLKTKEQDVTIAMNSMLSKVYVNIRLEGHHWCQRNSANFNRHFAQFPTEEQYQELKDNYEHQLQQRILREKQILLMEQNDICNKTSYKEAVIEDEEEEVVISHEQGFSCSASNMTLVDPTADPLIQQINLMRHYIAVAQQQKRYDEVTSLQTHLKELEIELFFVDQEKMEQEEEKSSLHYPTELDPFDSSDNIESTPCDSPSSDFTKITNAQTCAKVDASSAYNPFDDDDG